MSKPIKPKDRLPCHKLACSRLATVSLALSLSCLGLVSGLAQAAEPSAALVQPNANLLVQGIPAIPQSLADDVARYTDFRGHGFVDWHPSQREMLVSHRKAGANTAQLFSVSAPQNGQPGELQALSNAPDPVSRAAYEPKTGNYLVFERANGGDEVAQLYRLDLGAKADKTPLLLTPPQERHALVSWLHAGAELIYASTPLDRTAKGGSRAEVTTTFWQLNPLASEPLKSRRKLVELPGGGWFAAQLSWDDKQLALTRYLSANESEIWLLDLRGGTVRQVLPAKNQASAAGKTCYFSAGFSKDGKHLWFTGDAFSEFRELQRLNLATGEVQRVSAHIAWDASGVTFSPDGRRLVAQFNVEGRHELRVFDTASARELPLPKLPEGNVAAAHFDAKRGELAFSVNNAHGPSQIYSLSAQAQLQAWTQAYAPPGVDTRSFSEQQIIRWKSFDGQAISGLMTLPPAQKFRGKRPVLISIHGGPEAQASVGFLNRNNYFVMEQGIALIQPNVRGSSGFGKSFLAMDNGFKREDSVKDIGALLDWIATQPNLDASRVLIMGGSYGGYMTLATATHYADRIAGSIDVVGISHFVTFLTNTESYRRDLRRVEYGDERDPAMREFQEKISPLTNAHRIKKPLFVVQGKNDPRVPYTEAEQIVAKVRENGTPVWYLRADNEGHGFARKENQDFQFYATILFLRETLLKE